MAIILHFCMSVIILVVHRLNVNGDMMYVVVTRQMKHCCFFGGYDLLSVWYLLIHVQVTISTHKNRHVKT